MTDKFLDLAVAGIQGLHPYQPGKPVSELKRELGLSDIVKLASNENPLGPGEAVTRPLPACCRELAPLPGRQRVRAEGSACGAPWRGRRPASRSAMVRTMSWFFWPRLFAAGTRRRVFAVCVCRVPDCHAGDGRGARIAPAVAAVIIRELTGHDLDAMAGMVDARTRLVFIANPNNPTGTWINAPNASRHLDGLPAT